MILYMAYVNHKLNALFLHNVKCGGSYIRKLLIEHYNFEGLFIENHEDTYNKQNELHRNKLKMCKYLFLNQYGGITDYNNYFIFSFVRNPYDKLYSAYRYLYKQLKYENLNDFLSKEETADHYLDFNTFVKNYKTLNAISYFHGFIRQYEHLSDLSGNIMINYIGKLENIDNDFLNILSILNIDEITHNHELFFERKINKQSDDDFNIALEYNEESFDFVNKYFIKDFELFQYKKYDTLTEFRNEFDKKITEKKKYYYEDERECLSNKNTTLISNYFGLTDLENRNIVFDLYASILKIKYGITEEESFFTKIKEILDLLFLSIKQNQTTDESTFSNLNKNISEIIKIKDSILERNRNEINTMNIKTIKMIKDNYVKKYKCNNCNFSLFNITALNAHILFCKNKLKES